MSHPIAQDWERRDYISTVQSNLAAVVQFLNEFDHLTRMKLAQLNAKLTKLERSMDLIEASVTGVQSQSRYQSLSPGEAA